MIVHEIHDLTNTYVKDLLINGISKIDKSSPYAKNYHPDYQNDNGNLFYVLDNGRYRKGKGKYFILEDNGEYVSSAGWNEYDLDPSIVLVLTRMYTDSRHRMNYHIAKYILPLIIEEVKHYKYIWGTTNEYNKKIYNWFVRISQGKSGSVDESWPDIYKKFKPIGIKNIYYTDQYVLEYKP
jgi:hypothetical protein